MICFSVNRMQKRVEVAPRKYASSCKAAVNLISQSLRSEFNRKVKVVGQLVSI